MIYVFLGIALVGMILSFLRAMLGKSIESRVVAIDVLTTISAGAIVFYAYLTKNSMLLDVALVYSLLSFVGVVAVARYLEGGL